MPTLPAYDAYLEANHLAKVTPEGPDLAKRCYDSAIELDPALPSRTLAWRPAGTR